MNRIKTANKITIEAISRGIHKSPQKLFHLLTHLKQNFFFFFLKGKTKLLQSKRSICHGHEELHFSHKSLKLKIAKEIKIEILKKEKLSLPPGPPSITLRPKLMGP